MKKSFALALSIVMCLTLTLAGTISYLSDVDGDVNIMTLGRVDIGLIESTRDGDGFVQFGDIYPMVGGLGELDEHGMPTNPQFVDKIIQVESMNRNANAYLRVYIGVPSALENIAGDNNFDAVHLYMGDTVKKVGNEDVSGSEWPWVSAGVKTVDIDGVSYNMHCYNYNKLLEPGEKTRPLLGGVYMDTMVDNGDNDGYTIWRNGIEYSLDVDLSAGLQLPVLVQATQADGFTSLNQAFEASGMNSVDYSKIFDLHSAPILPDLVEAVENVEQWLNQLDALFQSGNKKHTTMVAAGRYDFSDGGTAAQLAAIGEIAPDGGYNTQFVAGEDGNVTLAMGGTLMPDPVILGVAGQPESVYEVVIEAGLDPEVEAYMNN